MNNFLPVVTLLFLLVTSSCWSQTTLYSRATSTWNNINPATGTWSTVGIGGPACGCLPSANDSVVISGNTVTMSTIGDCKSLTILNTGMLTIGNNIGLDINNSGRVTVQNGGTINHGGINSNAHIDFEAGNTQLIVELTGEFEVDDIYITANDTLEMSGAGDINLTDDFMFVGSNSMATSNITGDLNLMGADNSSLWFQPAGDNGTFINNGNMNCSRYIYIESDSNTIINNDTIQLITATRGISLIGSNANGTVIENNGVFTLEGDFQANSSTVTFYNRGTFDVNGDFRGFIGPGSVYNLEKATIKWAGTVDNNALRLYCNYDSSTFVYDGTAYQPDLFEPQDNYVNLVFENTGIKRYHNNSTVKGNMIVDAPLIIGSGFRYLYLDSAATITINSGGSMTQIGGIGRIQCRSNHDYTITIHDATDGLQWQRIHIDTNVNLTLQGDGIANLNGGVAGINFYGDGSTITNNLTDSLRLNAISFLSSSDTSTFTNNGNIVSTQDLYFGGSHNTFTNNGSYILGDDMTFAGVKNTYSGSSASSILVPDEAMFSADSNTVISGGTFTLGDQFLYNASACSLIVNGNMTVGNTFRVIAATNDNNVTTINSGASLSVASFMQLADADFVLKNSGTFNLTGAFDDFGGVDSIVNLAGGTINYEGVHNGLLNTEIDLYCDYTGSTFNYNRSDGTKQEVILPQDAYHHLTVSGSGVKEPKGSLQINGTLTIGGTAILDANALNVDLEIGESWINSGSFLQGTRKVSFVGATAGSISGSTNTSFYDLTINKSTAAPALALSSRAVVQHHLDLIDGVVSSSDGNEVIILDNATTSNGNDSSFISGPVQKVGDDPFIFPLGDNGHWARLQLSDLINSPAVTDTFTASYSQGRHAESFWDSLDYLGNPGGMKNVSIVEYWELARNSGNTQPRVTLYWEDGNSSYINDLTDLTIAHYLGGSAWKPEPTTVSGTVAAGSITTNDHLDTFSPFTFGSFTKGVNPLPITLLDFKATLVDDRVRLDWVTTAEINNDYFLIEKTLDGKAFETIGKVEGSGNSSTRKSYEYFDFNPSINYSYYRLRQVDFDGQYSYSPLVAISYQPLFEFSMYPNPASTVVHLKLGKDSQGKPLSIKLKNLEGRIMKEWYFENTSSVPLSIEGIDTGLYIMELKNQQTKATFKLMIIQKY